MIFPPSPRLDLDKWIYEPPSESEDEFKSNDLTFMLTSGGNDHSPSLNSHAPTAPRGGKKGKKRKGKKGAEDEEEEEEELEKVREEGWPEEGRGVVGYILFI